MKPRERLLAILVGACVGLFLLSTVYQQIAGAFEKKHKSIEDLEKKIRDKEFTVQAGLKASKKIAEWQKQSLPSDPELSRPVYYQWLTQLVDNVDLDLDTIDSPPNVGKNIAYDKFDFKIKAACDVSMNQLVQFMHQFYSTNQLHRIRSLSLKPKQDGKQMDVIIDIEALVIEGADRKDKLATETKVPQLLGDAAAYQKVIGGRNLFSPYTPPRPIAQQRIDPPPVAKPAFDVAKHTTITGIIEDNSRPQLWVRIKTTGVVLKLSEGEEFTVGDVQCKVDRIGVRDAVVTVGGKRKHVHLEENLRDAAEMPDGTL